VRQYTTAGSSGGVCLAVADSPARQRTSLWYEERFGKGGRRVRKIGIVALAPKLLIALWRYLETGEISKGAVLKAVTV
jgi:transposase